MGTKLTELRDGCFARAMNDEPMFVLLARDLSAPGAVDGWADNREAEIFAGKRPATDLAVVQEARQCARNMRAWRDANDGAWREGLFGGVSSEAVMRAGGVDPSAPLDLTGFPEAMRRGIPHGFNVTVSEGFKAQLGEQDDIRLMYANGPDESPAEFGERMRAAIVEGATNRHHIGKIYTRGGKFPPFPNDVTAEYVAPNVEAIEAQAEGEPLPGMTYPHSQMGFAPRYMRDPASIPSAPCIADWDGKMSAEEDAAQMKYLRDWRARRKVPSRRFAYICALIAVAIIAATLWAKDAL